jgi:hypothetical protein
MEPRKSHQLFKEKLAPPNQTGARLLCGICGHETQPKLDCLYDDRFGAPGAFAIVQCTNCGLEQTWPRPLESDLKG